MTCSDCRKGFHRRCADEVCTCPNYRHKVNIETSDPEPESRRVEPIRKSTSSSSGDEFIAGLIVGGIIF